MHRVDHGLGEGRQSKGQSPLGVDQVIGVAPVDTPRREEGELSGVDVGEPGGADTHRVERQKIVGLLEGDAGVDEGRLQCLFHREVGHEADDPPRCIRVAKKCAHGS